MEKCNSKKEMSLKNGFYGLSLLDLYCSCLHLGGNVWQNMLLK